MENLLKKMMERRETGVKCGIPSYCSANELVIEAAMEEAKRHDDVVLIEATANQVNQFGGYTGMQAADFVAFVHRIAERTKFDKAKLILGGDHLGPLTWCGENEEEAMKKSVELVKSFVEAGFTKIHLDTSMKLADDSKTEKLETEVIARRGAVLYKACMEAYDELLERRPESVRPVFIIGSEVPIPGGSQEAEDSVSATKVEDFEETVQTYAEIFKEFGFENAWDDIIAVVVQPGVEFGDANVCMYDRVKANALCQALKKYPNLMFEGHSTDYQSAKLLKEMVEDGVGILKVGPALTFVLREALFALCRIEEELLPGDQKKSNFIDTLDKTMLKNPGNWEKHYHGDEKQLFLARKYSFSDRSRYYMGEKEVKESMETLFQNLDSVEIPLTMIYQYMPVQYKRVRDGIVENKARELAKDAVVGIIYDYDYATKENYDIAWR